MMFNVPQFIDVEDKIAGPLTLKQLLWMIGMGASLLTVFFAYDGVLVFLISIPIVLIFAALAFYRPGGQSLGSYLASGFLFLFRPKIMVWDRPTGSLFQGAHSSKPRYEPSPKARLVTEEEVRRVAEIVDRR